MTLTDQQRRPHRSPSQYRMYLRCEAQYYFRYKEGLKLPPGSALTIGASVDESLAFNFRSKITTGEDEKAGRVLDYYVAEFDKRKDGTLWFPDEKPEELRDQAGGALTLYHKEDCPAIIPAEVQPDLSVELSTFRADLKQYGDLITTDQTIIDFKTASKSPPAGRPASFDDELQVTSYHLGYEAKKGKPPKGTELHYLVKTKTPKVVKVPVYVDAESTRYYENFVSRVEEALQRQEREGWNPIPNRSSFLCSRRFCGYADICIKNFGGHVKDGLKET